MQEKVGSSIHTLYSLITWIIGCPSGICTHIYHMQCQWTIQSSQMVVRQCGASTMARVERMQRYASVLKSSNLIYRSNSEKLLQKMFGLQWHTTIHFPQIPQSIVLRALTLREGGARKTYTSARYVFRFVSLEPLMWST